MAQTRQCGVVLSIDAEPERVFRVLITPSDIRSWWGASNVIVDPRPNGLWCAAWGAEDEPDYIATARLAVIDRPRRLVFEDQTYFARSEGMLPFDVDFRTSFDIEPAGDGSTLRIVQTGFPIEEIADDFFHSCEVGWKNTGDALKRHLAHAPSV